MASDMRGMEREMRRKWSGLLRKLGLSRVGGQTCRGFEALGGTKTTSAIDVRISTVVRGGCSAFTSPSERMTRQNLSAFYEKMPERHVKPIFIKDHLGCLYDA
ncbi:hypothetical protein EXN66_Car013235 [Channa argus]|uniref:Uncharacterized protein n=1 Tax=Channa argus TaxID=215402 RepID=A0A6G1Q4U0_CHAAH|nr:hypothetical protein EXN66_Car013235 [Channa argus]